MKKPLLIAASLSILVATFTRRKELKGIEKQIREGDLTIAQAGLKSLRTVIEGTEFAPQYCFLEAQANVEMTKENTNIIGSLQAAGRAFIEVKQLEGGKDKYISQLKELSNNAVNIAAKQADLSYKNKNYENAAIAFKQAYRPSPQDTVFLYNAAVVPVKGKDYDKAVKLYTKLKDLGYDGSETLYIAANKQTKKEETFGDKNQHDLMVKTNTHEEPCIEKTPSKHADIAKNIAFIYVRQHKIEDTIRALEDAKKAYPKDADIILARANVYLQLDNKDKFKELMQEAAQLDPEDANLYYNIGVISVQQDNAPETCKALEQALKIKPNYADTALNISATYISEGNGLIGKMNALDNSTANVKKFNESRDQEDDLFKKGAEVLENFTKSSGNVENILEQLKNIYGALGDSANLRHVKKLLGQ